MDLKVFYKGVDNNLCQIDAHNQESVSEAFLDVEAHLYNTQEKWNKPLLAVIQGGNN